MSIVRIVKVVLSYSLMILYVTNIFSMEEIYKPPSESQTIIQNQTKEIGELRTMMHAMKKDYENLKPTISVSADNSGSVCLHYTLLVIIQ